MPYWRWECRFWRMVSFRSYPHSYKSNLGGVSSRPSNHIGLKQMRLDETDDSRAQTALVIPPST
jgi:hypothetical protein